MPPPGPALPTDTAPLAAAVLLTADAPSRVYDGAVSKPLCLRRRLCRAGGAGAGQRQGAAHRRRRAACRHGGHRARPAGRRGAGGGRPGPPAARPACWTKATSAAATRPCPTSWPAWAPASAAWRKPHPVFCPGLCPLALGAVRTRKLCVWGRSGAKIMAGPACPDGRSAAGFDAGERRVVSNCPAVPKTGAGLWQVCQCSGHFCGILAFGY